jgi:hypothetical protein
MDMKHVAGFDEVLHREMIEIEFGSERCSWELLKAAEPQRSVADGRCQFREPNSMRYRERSVLTRHRSTRL